MRGYIGLSRVTTADSLLIAQPFNPLLFRMGAQPYPTLLFNVLRNKIKDENLKEECLRANSQTKQTKFLKDEKWQCWDCKQYITWNGFFRTTGKDGKDPQWQVNYSNMILKPGCLRRCMLCRIERGEDACLHTYMESNKNIHCDVCQKEKPASAFGKSAICQYHRAAKQQHIRCLDCSNPKCTSDQCPTCRTCRDVKCIARNCKAAIKTLNSHYLPTTYEQVCNFLCQTCSDLKRFPPCTECGRDMPRKKIRINFIQKNNTTWSCADCLNLQVSRHDRLKQKQAI